MLVAPERPNYMERAKQRALDYAARFARTEEPRRLQRVLDVPAPEMAVPATIERFEEPPLAPSRFLPPAEEAEAVEFVKPRWTEMKEEEISPVPMAFEAPMPSSFLPASDELRFAPKEEPRAIEEEKRSLAFDEPEDLVEEEELSPVMMPLEAPTTSSFLAPSDEPLLVPKPESRVVPEEEVPDSFQIASEEWAREQDAELREKKAAEERAAREAADRAEREQRERIEEERREAFLASQRKAEQDRLEAERIRLERNAEAERLKAEEQARLAREEQEARLRQAEEARLAREEQERLLREETARLQQAEKARLEREAEEEAERVRAARQRVEEARRALEKAAEEENQQARDAALKAVARQKPNFLDQQKTPLPASTALNDAQLPEPDIEPLNDAVYAPEMEEPALARNAFVPTVSAGPELAVNRVPVRVSAPPSPRVQAKLSEPVPEADQEQLLDDEVFDRGQKLLKRQNERLKAQIEVAQTRQKLLKEQARIRRKEEFNLGAWLAGAGPADLRECSDSERQKVCAIGYTVLVPTIFSLLSASYAASTLTTNPYVIGLVAVAWAIIILLVDRAIIATYSPNMGFIGKAFTILLRFVVAMLMGMTVSHPLTLLIFKDTITVHIEEQRAEEIAAAREKFAQDKKDLEVKVAEAQAELERQRTLYNQSFEVAVANPTAAIDKAAASGTLTPEEQVLLKQRTDDAAKPFQQELATLETSLQTAEARRAQLQTETDDWQRQYESEIGGQRSGVSGIGPRARSIETDQLSWRRADLQRLREEIASLSSRRVEIQKAMTASGEALRREMESVAAARGQKARQENERLAGLQQQLQEKKLQNLVSEGDNVRKGIQKAIDSALEELGRRRRELDELTALELKRMDDLRNNPRRDMLTQTLVMHEMFEHPEAGGNFALAAYIVLAALFLAIDTMPILVKFTAKKGEFDERKERANSLAAIPADLRKHDPIDAQGLRELVLEYDRQEQQLRVFEMHAKALEQQEKAFERQTKVHAKEKEVYERERDAMHAKADRDAALTLKNLEIAQREQERQRELADQERKAALAKQQAELEKLELAAKEAEANEAKAKAHLTKLNLEIVQNDPQGLLKHQLQEAQVARGRERFAGIANPAGNTETIAAVESVAEADVEVAATDEASPIEPSESVEA